MAMPEKEINKELEQLKARTKVHKTYRIIGWATLFALTYPSQIDLLALVKLLIGWHVLEFMYTLIRYFDEIKKLYLSDNSD